MSKLYLFAIGGTGARVLKSLTMLLASGVACSSEKVVPIIIDPDDTAADVVRTIDLLRKYMEIRQWGVAENSTENSFFKTEIVQTVNNFRLPLADTQDVAFKEFIKLNEMDDNNRALINMLFSQSNLEAGMQVGFKGNPNMGSVVLNQFAESQAILDFANDFQQGDKIFIISSIFGGTGASGFPLLLKTLLTDNDLPNSRLIRDAQIGAISVLPYFSVKNNAKSKIDATTFISKTKSALTYYERNISANNVIDTLYFIGDGERPLYENFEGGTLQKNRAHFVELVSAMAILDFATTPPNGNITQHKEFGLEQDNREVVFEDFGVNSQRLLQAPMTQFYLFSQYVKEVCKKEYRHQPWAIGSKMKVDFFYSPFLSALETFQQHYITWLSELSTNQRRFSPFVMNDKVPLFDRVSKKAPRKLRTLSKNYALFDNFLNKIKLDKTNSQAQQFTTLFYKATKNLVENKYNFIG